MDSSYRFLVKSNWNNHGFPYLILMTSRNFLLTSYCSDDSIIIHNETRRTKRTGTSYFSACSTSSWSHSSCSIEQDYSSVENERSIIINYSHNFPKVTACRVVQMSDNHINFGLDITVEAFGVEVSDTMSKLLITVQVVDLVVLSLSSIHNDVISTITETPLSKDDNGSTPRVLRCALLSMLILFCHAQ